MKEFYELLISELRKKIPDTNFSFEIHGNYISVQKVWKPHKPSKKVVADWMYNICEIMVYDNILTVSFYTADNQKKEKVFDLPDPNDFDVDKLAKFILSRNRKSPFWAFKHEKIAEIALRGSIKDSGLLWSGEKRSYRSV